MVVVLVVSSVRKVAQSEWDCSLTKKKLATVSVGHVSLEKRRLTSKTLKFSQRKMDIVVVNEMQTLEYDLDIETESFDIELSLNSVHIKSIFRNSLCCIPEIKREVRMWKCSSNLQCQKYLTDTHKTGKPSLT